MKLNYLEVLGLIFSYAAVIHQHVRVLSINDPLFEIAIGDGSVKIYNVGDGSVRIRHVQGQEQKIGPI